ncbi:MAG: biotin/lipoyl-containing protein, partial [Nitratireductor sp.]
TDSADTSEELRVGPVKARGRYTVLTENGIAATLSMREVAPGRWRVSEGDTVYLIDARIHAGVIEMATPEGRLVYRPAAPLDFAGGDAAGDRAVASPLTGMIVEIKVADGQPVAEGDVIAVMESMKLEISIRAAAAGIASNISVSNGDMVDRGQVIAEILPSEE